jgi:hypothetical protein
LHVQFTSLYMTTPTPPRQAPPKADPRPRTALQIISLIFTILLALIVVVGVIDLGDAVIEVVGNVLSLVGIALLVAPAIALGALAIRRPMHISKEARDLGRTSAVVCTVVGIALVIDALRSASTPALVGGLTSATVGGWVFTRSWMLPRPALDHPPRISVYRFLFSMSVITALALSAMSMFGITAPGLMGKEKRLQTAMRSDLRNMVNSQDKYRDSVGRFGTLGEMRAAGWKSSTGVYLSMGVDSATWRAIATHEVVPEECTIWKGKRPADSRFEGTEGEPHCRRP